MSAPDRLYMIRSQFYIGNFETCIQEASRINGTGVAENLEKMYYVYRSMIALGRYKEVLSGIQSSSTKTAELSAIEILAKYFSVANGHEECTQEISLLLNQELGNTPLVRIIACTIFNNENDYDHAYLSVKNADSIEELSVLVYTLVRMNRPDKANIIYSQMAKIDEDHILTQLAKTWINSNGDNDKMKENTYIYRELIDKLNESTMLVTNYLMSDLRTDDHASDPIQVEKCMNGLLDEYAKDNRNECVLRNLVVVSSILHKPEEEIEKYLKELEEVNPENPMVVTVKNMGIRIKQLEKEYV